MVANGALHGRQAVPALIGPEQQQHALRLPLAVALFLQQPIEEPTGNFAQFPEPPPQLIQLATMVLRRAMPRVLLFSARLSEEQQVPPQ